ncbi:MAG: hypothetical protein A2V64_09045 [Bacteroidetes bacterium RBG_13_43_22]|nr:MAG: hypothetical protein A2V64_09045 [Bacteroidetes bacterium RBG_13_43_22]OFY72774.1 MAG: hypothetical protein A2V46_08230 [Bacteroidetes bacterium RBG_19FT_COMBO_42_7]
MKKRKNLFLVILLPVLFFCSGTNAHSNSEIHRYYPEHASVSDNFENSLSFHADSSEEDQMDQSHAMVLPEQPECEKSGICILPHLNNLFVPVWQPPKVFRKKP